MHKNLPAISEVRKLLESLGHAEMQELAKVSTVPFTTLWKIRAGTTTNPGLETVRLFYPQIEKVRIAPANIAQAATENVAGE